MRLDGPLDDLFKTRTHVRVLRALDQLPFGFPVSAREVARWGGVSHPTASTVLASLRDQGVVEVRRAPRADAFELNRDHAAAERLRALFEWERKVREELVSFLRDEVKRIPDSISAAILFGSAVGAEMTRASDIDIAVFCEPNTVESVTAAMQEVGEAGRDPRSDQWLGCCDGRARRAEIGRSGSPTRSRSLGRGRGAIGGNQDPRPTTEDAPGQKEYRRVRIPPGDGEGGSGIGGARREVRRVGQTGRCSSAG